MASSSSSSSSSASSSAGPAESAVLEVDSDGVARRAGEKQYNNTMMRKNVHISTRTQYSNKQKKIVAWALNQPGLKDHVRGGVLQIGGLKKMASHAKWFNAFLTSLSYPDTRSEIPVVNDDADILLSKGISTMQGYKSALATGGKKARAKKAAATGGKKARAKKAAATSGKKASAKKALAKNGPARRPERVVNPRQYEVDIIYMQYLSVPIESGALGHKL